MLMVYDQIKRKHLNHKNIANVVVYGTGEKSVATIARLSQSPHYHVVGFLSEDSSEKSMTLADHPVFYYNDMEDLESIIAENQIDAILFATEKEASDKQDTLLQFATDKHIKVFLTPTIDEIGYDAEAHTVTVKATDENYLAGIYICSMDYATIYETKSIAPAAAGESFEAVFDVSGLDAKAVIAGIAGNDARFAEAEAALGRHGRITAHTGAVPSAVNMRACGYFFNIAGIAFNI